jgi:hypothetical protein
MLKKILALGCGLFFTLACQATGSDPTVGLDILGYLGLMLLGILWIVLPFAVFRVTPFSLFKLAIESRRMNKLPNDGKARVAPAAPASAAAVDGRGHLASQRL